MPVRVSVVYNDKKRDVKFAENAIVSKLLPAIIETLMLPKLDEKEQEIFYGVNGVSYIEVDGKGFAN